ncbi:unnamed protein product [Rotaria magnacalcarata]|uniref:SH3 domain-containing protein n=1 Tax=Rotaria magnacalcarata TaxID=392030 RepID=A0A815AVG7_9BILA|nr:unnamed protein product [Rotaria magnacalcarata]CAF1303659.1 unnamed protein product [Rotaria magnacalcarata]CAF2143023.1 unnamed protein product [Rotaria magnacalcarata]CAF2211877.1 unnamed protein product [Rotaria magnacalcarata]CAF2220581.1 unnamed protein product [Rotaria magnacalcarata]
MINDDQLQICLYHPHPNQSHRYTRQIIRITTKTTCREVLTHYVPDPNTARLVETCLGFEREIQPGDFLFDVITRNQAIEEFKIVIRRLHDNNNHHHTHRRRTTMRSPTLNNNHSSPHDTNANQQQQTNGNGFAISSLSMDLSLSELQEMAARQQQQIEHNQQLLLAREQRLKYLKQQELKQQQTSHDSLRLKRLKEHVEQQELKHLRLKTLQNQINQQRNSNSTLANELEILKQIFFDKEHELTIALNKVDELTKQLDQLRKIKITTNKEQSQNKNELDKLKQELMIRNKLNEQQSRKIAYQREVYASKQAELNQLDRRIEELQQRLKKKRILISNRTNMSTPSMTTPTTITTTTAVVEPFTSTAGYRTAFDTVQDTLNNVKIAEIEKRMVQLANSFNATSSSSPTNNNEQISNSNSPKKTSGMSSSNSQSKIAFASKSEIAATYMARTSNQSISPSLLNRKATDIIDSTIKTEQQLLPPNLRLNDDILSVHFNNVTSTIKKRHSLSDPADSLIKYLSSNVSSSNNNNNNNNIQTQAIQVRDDSSNQLLTDTKISPVPTVVAYENLIDIQTNLNNKLDEEQKIDPDEHQIMIESMMSDTESDGEHSDGIESAISSPRTITTTATTSSMNLKSLLKTSTTPKNLTRRVMFDPLALLLDAAVVGELDLVIKAAKQVENPSQPNDEGLTALHNAVCASNFECVKFLVEFGCDINFADNDGWTPLHCAASCNNTPMVQFLVEHGACIYATTIRDNETAAEKCEEEEENYATCSQYLLFVQNDLGVINNGLVYGLYDFEPSNSSDDTKYNELTFKDGDQLRILRRGDEHESEWWWARHETNQQEGYVPRNYLGLYPRVRPGSMASTSC